MIRHLRLPNNEKLLLPILLEELLYNYGDRPVSFHDDLRGFDGAPQRELSLAELVDEVSALCRFLRDKVGLKRGERIAIYKSNDARYFRWFLAVIRAGGIAVPINPLLSFTEAQRIIVECTAIAIITDSTIIAPHLNELKSVASVHLIQDVGEELIPGFVQPTADLLGAPALPAVDVGLDETIAVFYTSGTLGKPSGAMLSSRSFLVGRPLASLIIPLVRNNDIALFPLPWAHVYAVTTAIVGLMAGVPAHFMTRFEARRAIEIIWNQKITAFIGVPAMLVKLMEAQPSIDQLRSIKLWVSAADHLPPACRDQLMKYGASFKLFGKRVTRPLLINAYGMVELGGIAMLSVDAPLIPGKGELCIPLPHIRVRIVDEHDKEQPRGIVGECLIKSAGNISGYWEAPDATERLITPDSWVRTGDLAKRTRAGFIKLTGRAKDVIKSGGYLIHPQEIEDVISSHPLVSRAVVVGMPHRRLGEIPVAVVESRADSKPFETELLEWCRTHLATFKQPREVYVVKPGEIPEGPTNKALRGAVREKLVATSISEGVCLNPLSITTVDSAPDIDSRVLNDLRTYGYNSFSSCLLYSGFKYYFPDEGNGFIAYFEYSSMFIVLGEPVCPRQDYGPFTEKFLDYCRRHKKLCAFVCVGDEFVSATAHLSWTKIALGEDMVFNISEYAPSGDKAKKVRSARNQILKRGAQVKEYKRSFCIDRDLEFELERMTERWLHSHSIFQMWLLRLDLFSIAELKRYFYVEFEGKVVALLTCIPIYARNGYLFEDLIRDPIAPNGATELLILEALRIFRNEGLEMATLGLSPKIEIRREWGFSWWDAGLIRLGVKLVRKLSGFETLYHYRKKFNTRHMEKAFLLKHPEGLGIRNIIDILKSFNLF